MRFQKFLFLILFLNIINWSCKETKKADLILINAIIYSAEDSNYVKQAMAIDGNIIKAIGTNEEILTWQSSHSVIKDCQQAFIMPGLIEGHGHYLSLGESLINLNLLNTKSWQEITDSVSAKVNSSEPNQWISGRGWHQDKWNIPLEYSYDHYPYHDMLSTISPNNPVVLYHASGHALLANKKAMDLAQINAESVAPTGGRIVRDQRGKLTGVFEENAMDLITKIFDESNQKDASTKLKIVRSKSDLAYSKALDYGITSFQDAGTSLENIQVLKNLSNQGAIPIRLNMMMYEDKNIVLKNGMSLPIIGSDPNFFKSNAIKAYVDGALGSYGAWLLEPYTDNPKMTGQLITPLPVLDSIAQLCKSKQMQMCVHAIGDRANRALLDLFGKYVEGTQHRWRIEHAQHINPDDIIKFKKFGVIASMQAIHCTSDAPFVEKRLGHERAKNTSYRWRTLIDAGVHLANGTDVPVESINPYECIYASVTRKRIDNDFEFFPEEKMSRHEALRSYTIWNAYAAGDETIKGSLEPGKLADFIILDRNLLTCSDLDITKTSVKEVYINGKKIR